MMFQSYALFPHMTVRDNVAYGVKAEKLDKEEVAARVDGVLRTVDLEPLADRRPHQLSGRTAPAGGARPGDREAPAGAAAR